MNTEWARSFSFLHNKRLRLSFGSVFFFGLIAHAFSYFALAYSHDSLYCLYRTDTLVHIGYGRFLQPVYTMLRGNISVPWLCGLFSLLWLALALYLLTGLFQVRQTVTVVLLGAVMATYPMLAFTNATYLNFTDIFMSAFLLTVLAVWFLERWKFGFLAGAVCVAAALGQYQCFIGSACGLLIMLFILKAVRDKASIKALLLFALKGAAMLLLGGLLYKVVLDGVLRLTGAELLNTYNGIADVGDYEGVSRFSLVLETYRYILDALLRPATDRPELVGALTVVMALLGLVGLGRLAQKNKPTLPALLWALAALLVLPFAANVTYFVSKGMMHELMIFPFVLIPAFCLILADQGGLTAEELGAGQGAKRLSRALGWVLAAAVGLTAFSNVVFSNDLYLKKQLEYQSTQACMTRVMDEMEHTENYAVGQTPVVFVGSLGDSAVARQRTGFEKLRGVGLFSTYAITFFETESLYMEYIMGYPMNAAPLETKEAYAKRPDVAAMPAFPSPGYCQILDGVMVVKFSQPDP